MLDRHARALRATGAFAEVRAASLFGREPLDRCVAGLAASSAFVVPMVMSAGRTVSEHLAGAVDRLGAAAVLPPNPCLCPPLGLHPGLADLVVRRAREALARRGSDPARATLLVVGHGSLRDPASRRAAGLQAGRIRAHGAFARVVTAFLEEPPRLADVVPGLAGPLAAVGLFAANGVHAGRDIPAALGRNPAAQVLYLGAIGEDEAIPALVLDLVRAEAARRSG